MITITEGLAELKTIQKRIEKKREYIGEYLARQDGIKDPLEKEGGAAEVIKRERQAIGDLEARHIAIRFAIQKVNQTTDITIEEITKTIAEWLTWRKEIAPGVKHFLLKLRNSLTNLRTQAQKNGFGVIPNTATPTALTDYIVNIDEAKLAKEIETLETILGTLDGQLSLKNATITIDV